MLTGYSRNKLIFFFVRRWQGKLSTEITKQVMTTQVICWTHECVHVQLPIYSDLGQFQQFYWLCFTHSQSVIKTPPTQHSIYVVFLWKIDTKFKHGQKSRKIYSYSFNFTFSIPIKEVFPKLVDYHKIFTFYTAGFWQLKDSTKNSFLPPMNILLIFQWLKATPV